MNEIINYKLHNLKRIRSVKKWNNFNYLKKLSAERLHERLFEIKRNFNLKNQTKIEKWPGKKKRENGDLRQGRYPTKT